ncbi:unnamed protein product [Pieris brassicae]|uniref:Trissin n=1 Tax=Pieris brassicae TaxID=7116 RepID=A0A9P0X0X1_PIEBR|nr:unnamed protein product [Pieris brassicae]
MWAVALNCQSCGDECAPACGTRYFRTCCFNYLRRKRGFNAKMYSHSRNELPQIFLEDTWTQDPIDFFDTI